MASIADILVRAFAVTLDALRFMAREGVQTVRQKNAIQPLLWLCLFVSVPCFYLGSDDPLGRGEIFIWIGVAPVAATILSYLWFMFKDPGRLQSEEFQLRDRALDIIETKGGKVAIGSADIEKIINPHQRDAIAGDTGGGR